MSLRIAVLLSGSGTTFDALAERAAKGALDVVIAGVISSKPDAAGLARARAREVQAVVVDRKALGDERAFQAGLHAALEPWRPELVVLAGFLSRFELRGRYVGRAMNSHPALIPAFCGKGMYGDRVHRAVLEYGVRVTGATIHFCDDEYDTGPVILQQPVSVEPDDTLETLRARVQPVERELYARAIQLFGEGRLRLEGRRVRVLPAR